ncbi:hypothetical protein OROGR_008358 [Orobanche gracilis]
MTSLICSSIRNGSSEKPRASPGGGIESLLLPRPFPAVKWELASVGMEYPADRGVLFLEMMAGADMVLRLFLLKNRKCFFKYGTRTREKNELLDQLSGVIDYYNTLSPMFRHGSSVYWDRVTNEKESSVVVTHCNIIETSFWEAHPDILDDKAQWLCLSNYVWRLVARHDSSDRHANQNLGAGNWEL